MEDILDLELNNTQNGQPTDLDNIQPDNTNTAVDDNNITITDRQAPIVMLFGPPSSGKSMTLVRLARYLRTQNYAINTDPNFKFGPKYEKRCKEFLNDINTSSPLPGTPDDAFLMVKVSLHGRTICQLLEAPGEHYFNPIEPETTSNTAFRPYLSQLISATDTRKIWIYITEAQWKYPHFIKSAYVSRIKACKHELQRPGDQVILLFNKIDKEHQLFENGSIHVSSAHKAMRDEYSGLAEAFKNDNPLSSLWRPYNYKFVPFSTGSYATMAGGTEAYTESNARYPRMLWQAIMKCIKG